MRYYFSESLHNSHRFRKYAVELLEATYLPKQPVSSEWCYSWTYRLADLAEPSKVLDTALFAFCLVQLHVAGPSNISLYQCLEQYNIALQHLYSGLNDSERRYREETLAAVIVLSTCEVSTGAGSFARFDMIGSFELNFFWRLSV